MQDLLTKIALRRCWFEGELLRGHRRGNLHHRVLLHRPVAQRPLLKRQHLILSGQRDYAQQYGEEDYESHRSSGDSLVDARETGLTGLMAKNRSGPNA